MFFGELGIVEGGLWRGDFYWWKVCFKGEEEGVEGSIDSCMGCWDEVFGDDKGCILGGV